MEFPFPSQTEEEEEQEEEELNWRFSVFFGIVSPDKGGANSAFISLSIM